MTRSQLMEGFAMTHEHEIPSDAQVRAMLENCGPMSAPDLVAALIEDGHDGADSRRAVHRCLNRGSITIDASLNLMARAYA